jgi:CubicO group peptidase (beta-lactamase class C family)
MWINAVDMARFGYLWLRGGKWGDKQILPPAFVKDALTPGGAPNSPGNGYGYLWWLNTTGKALPGMPTNAYSANGAGSNTITVSPDHDLVIVWRWHQGSAGELGRRVIAAIKPGTM